MKTELDIEPSATLILPRVIFVVKLAPARRKEGSDEKAID